LNLFRPTSFKLRTFGRRPAALSEERKELDGKNNKTKQELDMKLTTALSTAAFVLVPGAGFAMEPSSEAGRYPYPDWPAIAKPTPSPQKNADQQKPEQNAPANKSESNLLEKAAQAIEAVTGRSSTKEGVPQMKPAEANQKVPVQEMKATKNEDASPYPDWGAIAKTAAPSHQKSEEQQKSEQNLSGSNKGEPGLLEEAGQAIEAVTGRSAATKEDATQMKPAEAKQGGREQYMKEGAYPYPDWPAIAKGKR
jgi:hypothetical protein